MINKTFEQCAEDQSGTIYADWEDGEFRCLVMRGPSHMCGYVGVKPGHILWGVDYNDIPLDCHGGLNFAANGDNENNWPAGYWWLGWDYGHSGDYAFYYLDKKLIELGLGYSGGHKWTPDEVATEFPEVINQLRRIQRIPKVTYEYIDPTEAANDRE